MGVGNIFGWIDRTLGGKASDVGPDLVGLGNTGTNEFDAGTSTLNEGLGDLRTQQQTYTDLLKNPLGTGPNSASAIFARARGGLSDAATRATNTLGVRLAQQARQSGGNLSPEAQAELAAQNERDTNQNLFEGNVAISNAEATATLSETSKLFDRLDNISRTILGVGENERSQGLQALISALGLRLDRNKAIANTIVSATKPLGGGSTQPTPTNTVTGVG